MPLLQIGVKWGKEALEVEVDTSGTGLDLKTQLKAANLNAEPTAETQADAMNGGGAAAPDGAMGSRSMMAMAL